MVSYFHLPERGRVLLQKGHSAELPGATRLRSLVTSFHFQGGPPANKAYLV